MEIKIKSTKRQEFVDVTEQVIKAVAKKKVKEGLCLVYCPHTTAGITVNENVDKSARDDVIAKLNSLVPKEDNYRHNEGNSDAHVKASIIGNSRVLPISKGKLSLGQWEGIFFCEFDGPRERTLSVTVVG